MVATHARRHAVPADSLDEELEDRGGAIVRMNANPRDKARVAVDEAMSDELPSYEPWGVGE